MRALVADPNNARARRVLAACASRGVSVDGVPHGAAALERCLIEPPDLLVCPVDLPMIDGAKLAEILRTNPRTREVAFLYLVEDELDVPVGTDPRDRFAVAPWDEEEIARQIDGALQREAPLRDAAPGEGIEGNLSQVCLLDLLQLFHVNKKSGTVHVDPEGFPGPGTVVLRAGEVVDAAVTARDGHPIGGTKALFRLIACDEGRFQYTPEDPGGPPQIETATRALLLEGMRQIDEEGRFRQTLPSPGLRVRPTLSVDALPSGTHPLTRDVLRVAANGATVQEIVDRVPFPDYQVLQTLNALLTRGVLEADRGAPGPERTPESGGDGEALDSSKAARIREWASGQRPAIRGHVRVPVVARDPDALEAFAAALFSTPGVRAPAHQGRTDLASDRMGPFAEMPVGEGLSLLFLNLPGDASFRPIWPVATHGMIGGVILHSGPLGASLAETQEIQTALAESGQPVVHVLMGGATAPGEVERSRLGGALLTLGDDGDEGRRSTVRELIAEFAPGA
jgi:CheY-like chemotaxis protein